MPIEFNCPACQSRIRTPDGSAGKMARCPQCGAVATVPIARQVRPALRRRAGAVRPDRRAFPRQTPRPAPAFHSRRGAISRRRPQPGSVSLSSRSSPEPSASNQAALHPAADVSCEARESTARLSPAGFRICTARLGLSAARLGILPAGPVSLRARSRRRRPIRSARRGNRPPAAGLPIRTSRRLWPPRVTRRHRRKQSGRNFAGRRSV